MIAPLSRLPGDARGVTIVEFAAILPVLCLVLMGIFDLGYRSYVSSVVQGALHEAARMATVGGVTKKQIDAHVKQRLVSFSHGAEVVTRQTSYAEFSGVKRPEREDKTIIGRRCFWDANGNGVWDDDQGREGLGGADDIVNYEVSITYSRLFPVGALLGWSDEQEVSASTVLKSQPFAARTNQEVYVCED